MLNLRSRMLRFFMVITVAMALLAWFVIPVVAWAVTNAAQTVDSSEEEFTHREDITELTTTVTTTTTTLPPKQYYNLSDSDKELLARIIYLEAGAESIECQLAIGSVIMNRLEAGHWGDTLEEVIYSPYQFSPADQIPYTTPLEEQYEVVDTLIADGPTMPYYVLYFRAWYYFDWALPYTEIEDVYFSYLEYDIK